MQAARRVIQDPTCVSGEDTLELLDVMSDQLDDVPNIVDLKREEYIVVGDLHGELEIALEVKRTFFEKGRVGIVFLGDYGDRGPRQLETVNLVLSMALMAPDRVVLLRGNHESRSVAMYYGFYDAVLEKHPASVFESYVKTFRHLPIAAVAEDMTMLCHGGVPDGVHSLDQLRELDRKTDEPSDPVLKQLLWNDPVEADLRFIDNPRGPGIRRFGRLAFDEFCRDTGVKRMVRAHEAFPEGYAMFFDGRLVSVFSCTYGGVIQPKVCRLRSGQPPEFLEMGV
ncbi:MAG: metallophosphoesterase [Candidatus Thorarchaeota archaeon]